MHAPLRLFLQCLPPALAALLCMAAAAYPLPAAYGISPLTIAIVCGIIAGNTFLAKLTPRLSDGLTFCKTRLLRLGIMLYGLKITLGQLFQAGWPALLADTAVIGSTFILAMFIGKRLGLPEKRTALIGSGAAICGAAAVLATQPVVKADDADVGVAVATVVVFGTLAMFAYPLAAAWLLPAFPDDKILFAWGIFTGSSIHEVAQVAAAGTAIHPLAADTAVITKMIRVMLLAPFLLILPWLMQRFTAETEAESSKLPIPWFAVGFLSVVILNSIIKLPPALHQAAVAFDTFLLTAAMFSLGLTTRWHSIRQAGGRPLLLAGLLAVWLPAAGTAVSYAAYLSLG